MAIGEIFLTAFIQVLFEKLASPDLWNLARGERIGPLLKKWQNMLEQIKSVLADAEEKQIADQGPIKPWLEELEDLAYDLDDVLDEFATEALRQKVMEDRRGSTSKVRALVPTWLMSFKPTTIASGFRLRSQINEITARLQALFERRAGLGLRNDVSGPSAKTSQRPPSSSLIHEPHLYGTDEDKKVIIELLLCEKSSNEKVGIVPIVGMGGVGKTTLAQDVYNDDMVGKHFEIKAWVCVSDIVGVSKEIFESVSPGTCNFNTLDKVQVELKKVLAGKKFLIVLDDVWNEKHGDWMSLRSPFNEGALGSKVMVTTRNIDVASMMAGIGKFHILKKLSDDDCWFVFEQHAFENRNIEESPNLVSIGQKIVKKCGGLPLAARTLGGLLRCKESDGEWEEVLHSKMWELKESESDVLPALRLSYYHLPSHLKKCFEYCSVLPQDYEFEEKELVLWWMAEGLIHKKPGDKQMEDLGHDYFRELLSRSFFQPSSHGEVSLFVMHDLINDLAQFAARRICFRMEENLENGVRDKNITKARHSSFTRGDYDGREKFEIFRKAENLRSFLPFGLRDKGRDLSSSYLTSDVPLHLLLSLGRLRVLSLRRYLICELPSSIGKLKHVRFLDLTRALISTLPESVGALYNLQTLILRDCKNLRKLPPNTSNLVNLRHLDLTGTYSLQEMPTKIGELTSLQTLSKFIVSQGDGSTINELGNLNDLKGTLSISRLENVKETKRANLKDKKGLHVLLMKWSSISNIPHNARIESEVLSMLRPHKNLEELTLDGYHGREFPSWVGDSSFSMMVCLKLQNCEKCISLPPLGQLSSLKKLYIQGMKGVEHVGREFYGTGCSNPFPALEILTFEDMPRWNDWSPSEVELGAQAFSRLSELSIERCSKLLGKLPNNLPELKKLDIKDCPLLVVNWGPSQIGLTEVRDIAQFDSLISLSLEAVLLQNSFDNSEVGNEPAVAENARHGQLSSLTFLRVQNIQGLTCLPNWFFQGLTGLQELSILGCKELTSLWKNEVRTHHCLPALRRLVIEGCPQLISLFEEDEEEQRLQEELPCMMLLEYLKIEECEKIEKLPRGLHNLRSLQELIIAGCPSLISFPETGLPAPLRRLNISNCKALRSLPELTMLHSLEELEVKSCSSLTYISRSRTGLPCNLKKLKIYGCAKLESVLLEDGVTINCPSLESVAISFCDGLKSLPDVTHDNFDGGCLKNLTYFTVLDCENVESIPEGWFTATNLRDLSVSGCKKLKGLPDHACNNLTSLQSLKIDGCDAATVLTYLQSLTRRSCHAATELTPLQTLGINSCDMAMELISFSSHFTNLTELWLFDIDKGSNKPPSQWGLHRLSSLTTLFLEGYCGASFPPIEEEEEDGMMLWLPPSLVDLGIWGFPNLEKLSFKEFQNIPSLKALNIRDCPNLTTIAELGLLSSLSQVFLAQCPKLASLSAEEQGLRQLPLSLLRLEIIECPTLKQRCEKKKGRYWPLISHIPRVMIQGRNVFDPSYDE